MNIFFVSFSCCFRLIYIPSFFLLLSCSISLKVLQNENLQGLFPAGQEQNMTIMRPALFDKNPKLCPEKIDDFKTHLNLTDDMIFVGKNGDRMPCKFSYFFCFIPVINVDGLIFFRLPRSEHFFGLK